MSVGYYKKEGKFFLEPKGCQNKEMRRQSGWKQHEGYSIRREKPSWEEGEQRERVGRWGDGGVGRCKEEHDICIHGCRDKRMNVFVNKRKGEEELLWEL